MTDVKEQSFEERKLLAIKEIEQVCRKFEVDILPIIVHAVQPTVSSCSLQAQLSVIDVKGAPKVSTLIQPEGSKKVIN